MKIASWNVEGRLTLRTKRRRGTPERILDMIEEINADVFVLPEAYITHPASGVNERLEKMGYTWRDVRYDEHDREPPSDNYIRILSRLKITKSEQLRWGDLRGLLSITVADPVSGCEVRFIATHLDERSDERRLRQLSEAIDFISSSTLPTIMLGDFNSMHDDRSSRFIQNKLIKVVVSFIPHKQIRKRAATLIEMASGKPLEFLESKTNLRDIDSRHQPTTTPKLEEMDWMPNIRVAQIDHLYVSPDILAGNFAISKDGGSDHRAISADIIIKSPVY